MNSSVTLKNCERIAAKLFQFPILRVLHSIGATLAEIVARKVNTDETRFVLCVAYEFELFVANVEANVLFILRRITSTRLEMKSNAN